MKRRLLLLCTPLLSSALVARAMAADASTSIAGIKEALAVGTENAVKSLGRENGYFANQAVKILLPGSVQKLAEAYLKAVKAA